VHNNLTFEIFIQSVGTQTTLNVQVAKKSKPLFDLHFFNNTEHNGSSLSVVMAIFQVNLG